MLQKDITQIEAIAKQLGHKLLAWRQDPKARSFIDPGAFKTNADLWAHKELEAALTRLYPDVPIISEEDPDPTRSRPETYWLIDPIDGTKSWFNGHDGFAIQIALIENAQPILGIVHAPAQHKTWSAIQSSGAFCNGEKLSQRSPAATPCILSNSLEPSGLVQRLSTSFPGSRIHVSGSIGIKCALVAEGTADLYVVNATVNDWDLVPAIPFLHETSCLITDLTGAALKMAQSSYTGFIVASSEDLLLRTTEMLASEEP